MLVAAALLLVTHYHRAAVEQAFASAGELAPALRAVLLEAAIPLIVLVTLGLRFGEIGLGAGNTGVAARLAIPAAGVCLVCLAVFSSSGAARQFYAGPIEHPFRWIVASSVSVTATEFFFRGYLLLGLRRTLGDVSAVLIQLLPYVLVHAAKPEAEAFGAIPVGLALAFLALRTNSIWYGAVLHATAAAVFPFAARALGQ